MLRKSIPSKPGQGSPVISREKSAANHIPRRILFVRNVKQLLGFSMNRRIEETNAQIHETKALMEKLAANWRFMQHWKTNANERLTTASDQTWGPTTVKVELSRGPRNA